MLGRKLVTAGKSQKGSALLEFNSLRLSSHTLKRCSVPLGGGSIKLIDKKEI